jgi:urease accessory protein
MNDRCAGAGDTPHLDLSFRHHAVRGTWLDRRVFRWPYTLSRGFRLDSVSPDMLTLIVQTVSGAIQADDQLVQRIHVGRGAAAHVTSQGATPVYRAPSGMSAEDDIALEVEDGGCIEHMPDLRILFPDASLTQRIRVQLPPSATAIVADGFVMHDPGGAGRPFRRYHSSLLLQRPDGTLLAADRLVLDAPPSSGGRRAQYVAHGTLFVAACRPESCLQALCRDAEARLAALSGIYAAASTLPNGAGAVCRIAAIDGRHLRLGLRAAWGAARLHLFGREPVSRQ